MERKKTYETPLIERFRVELEDGVCATGSMVGGTTKVEASAHETGFEGTYVEDATTNEFNTIEWK